MDTIPLPKLTVFFFLLSSVILLSSVLGPQGAEAQNFFRAYNGFVQAEVSNDGQGLLTILSSYNPPDYLTFPGHSYLTLQVGGIYYTNNPNNPTIIEPSGEGTKPDSLGSGKTMLLKGISPYNDTIRTIWQPQGPNAFDIIQDVYPLGFYTCGQIVIKISIFNHSLVTVAAQAQFLFDLQTSSSDPNYSTDIPPVTTRAGYNANTWQDFPDPAPYFITNEYDLCSSNHFAVNPDNLGAGFTADDLAPGAMGLMKPSDMAIVDWPAIATTYLWGYPAARLGTVMADSDNAMLFQWPASAVASESEQEIGRTSYGTPPCQPICYGNLYALMLHPYHIVWNGTAYEPNRFPVEAIVWNPNSNANATGAVATVGITNGISGQRSGPIQVVSPAPISADGFSQSHPVRSGGSSQVDSLVPECGMGYVTWEDTVLASVLPNCNSSYDITVSLSASGVSQPIFLNEACVCPISVDCQEKDTASTIPILTVLSRTGSFDGSICNARTIHGEASDPRMCASCFVKSVSATQLQNMTFAIEDSTSWKYVVSVIDSMQNGSATVYALDATGVWDTAQYSYCTIADTHAPRIEWVDCLGDTCICYHNIFIHEVQPWDRGLDTVIVKSMAGVIIRDSTGSVRGKTSGAMCIADNFLPGATLCVEAIDLAGNKTDTCFSFAPSGVASSAPEHMMLLVSPNPASGTATISLHGAPSANVEIFDVLGREVTNFHIEGYYEWQTGLLPAGAYIVRASVGGAVVSKRMLKQ